MVCFCDVLGQYPDLSINLEEIEMNTLQFINVRVKQCFLKNFKAQNIVFFAKTKNLTTIYCFEF